MKVLVIVDMQNDFITGPFGTEEAKDLVPILANFINLCRKRGYKIITTRDEHVSGEQYNSSKEGAFFPIHCERDSLGAQFDPAIKDVIDHDGDYGIEKNHFGSVGLVSLMLDLNEQEPVDQIIITGVCTDICVIQNAMTLATIFPNADIWVPKDLTAGVDPESKERALKSMNACLIGTEPTYEIDFYKEYEESWIAK